MKTLEKSMVEKYLLVSFALGLGKTVFELIKGVNIQESLIDGLMVWFIAFFLFMLWLVYIKKK